MVTLKQGKWLGIKRISVLKSVKFVGLQKM